VPTRTRRQREVLDFIIRYIDNHGYEPSYQLIARELGVSSKAGIAKHIKALEEQDCSYGVATMAASNSTSAAAK
jgi:SOS-response transcriptional repressor LexA